MAWSFRRGVPIGSDVGTAPSPSRAGPADAVQVEEGETVTKDLLALVGDDRCMAGLVGELRRGGYRVDLARDLGEARTAYLAAGGHDCVLVAPDVAPGTALSVLMSLRVVDPRLRAATFGPRLVRDGNRVQAKRLAFHPGSRAGLGALLRFLQEAATK